MPEEPTFTIREMRADDLDQAISLARSEGWNQTENDWRLLFDNRENICIVAENEARVAGTATALNHSNKTAWIGMVLVDRSLRGQGAGKLLMENIIGRLGHVESVKLDATPAGEPLYRKLGFEAEYRIFRMTAEGADRSYKKSQSDNLSFINHENFQAVLQFDLSVFGADRSYLLNKLLTNYPGKAFYLKDKSEQEGYIFGRDGARFNYIGPVIATSGETARKLIEKALESLNNEPIALDIPEDKEDLILWLESIGFVKQRHFVRMYLKTNPYPGVVNNLYLISGPEYG